MKLSLSVRIAESFHSKTESEMAIDELIDVATSLGYSALCMRASQAGVESPSEVIAEMRRKIDAAGLRVSMVTGDFAVPQNNEHGPDGLRDIGPYLDVAEGFGADLVRICMKKDEDIAAARAAADEAAARGIRLAHQSHMASLFETPAESLRVLREVDRPNFGLIYEPANWLIVGEDYVNPIRELAPWIFNVYIQNHRVHEDGEDAVETWCRGRVALDHIGVWEKGGVETERVFEALHAIGYDGHVTVHQAFGGIMSPVEAARRSFEYLSGLISR